MHLCTCRAHPCVLVGVLTSPVPWKAGLAWPGEPGVQPACCGREGGCVNEAVKGSVLLTKTVRVGPQRKHSGRPNFSTLWALAAGPGLEACFPTLACLLGPGAA